MLFKQLLVVGLMVGAVACSPVPMPGATQGLPSQAAVPAPSGKSSSFGKFATGVLDVGIISAKNLGRLGMEVKPHLNQFSRAVGKNTRLVADSIRSNDRFKEVLDKASPQFENGIQKMQPFVSDFGSRLTNLGQRLKPAFDQGKEKLNQGVNQLKPVFKQKVNELHDTHMKRQESIAFQEALRAQREFAEQQHKLAELERQARNEDDSEDHQPEEHSEQHSEQQQ